MTRPIAGALVALAASTVAAQAPASRFLAILNGRIHTVSSGVIERGTVVVRDGRIVSVGASVTAPAGAEIVDAAGLDVYPGLFDANSTLGLTAAAREREMGPILPHIGSVTSFDLEGDHIDEALAIGVMHLMSRQSGGVIPGEGVVVALGGSSTREALLASRGPIVIQFPSTGDLDYSDDERYEVIPWSEARQAYDRGIAALARIFADARAYGASPPAARDARLDALQRVLRREQRVLIETTNHVELRDAVLFGEAQKLDFLVTAAEDTWAEIPFLKAHAVKVVLQLLQNVPGGEDDPVDAVYTTPARLQDAGVAFALSTGTVGYDSRNLPYQAGFAAAYGLPYEAALRAVTLTPAEFYGVERDVGSIDPGKRANLVIVQGDILDYTARVKAVFINGARVSAESAASREYDAYLKRGETRK